MDMALDDVIMQERAAKRNERKKWRQQRPRNLAAAASVPNSQATSSIKGHRTAAATAAATTSTVLTSGPQRTRAKARERRRERAKPYARATPSAASTSAARSPLLVTFSNPAAAKKNMTKKAASIPPPPPPSSSSPKRSISIVGEAGPAAITVDNIHPGATSEDIKTVFSKYGTIQQCTAFYDQHGRATGRAEIVYALRADAEAAVKALHNVEADGLILQVQFKGKVNQTPPAPAPAPAPRPQTPVKKSGPLQTTRTTTGVQGGLYSDQMVASPSRVNRRRPVARKSTPNHAMEVDSAGAKFNVRF